MSESITFDYDNTIKTANRLDVVRINGMRKKIGASIMLCAMGGAGTDAANHIQSYNWETFSEISDVEFRTAASEPLRDHVRQIIGTGVRKPLEIKALVSSLMENSGEKMDQTALNKYKEMMEGFAGIPVIDILSDYSVINKLVRTVLVMPKGIALNLTFFAERESDIMTFSIDFENENILTGRGHSAEIAERTIKFLDSIQNV